MKLPIQWRLTLWYGAAFAVMIGVLCVAILMTARHALMARTDHVLQEELRELSLEAEISSSEPAFLEAAQARFFEHDAYDFLVQRGDGHVIFRSYDLVQSDLQERLPSVVRGTGFSLVNSKTNQPVRIVQAIQGTAFGDLRISAVTSLAPVEKDIDSLQTIMFLLSPICLVFALVGGYGIASRMLKPIRQLIAAANEVTINTLHYRVPFANDNDEIGQLGVTINSLIQRLETAVSEIRRFTADASHELRTPIAALRAEAELALNRERTPDEYVRALSVIHEETCRLTRLAGQLLDLSRLDAGTQDVSGKQISVLEVATECVEQLARTAYERNVQVWIECEPTVVVAVDPIRLHQLLTNLVANAIQHSPPETRITISAEWIDGWTEIRVCDEGYGIASEHLPFIFERFYRADASRSFETGGSGLGLSIVKAITNFYQGTVEIQSQPGVGTRVVLRLPDPRESSQISQNSSSWQTSELRQSHALNR